jgi:hypothetical protein
MSEDFEGFDAGDYSLFRYCHNDPEDLTDPMGTETNMAGFSPLDNHNASVALWEMTKWFDRSNTIQGMFPGFAALSGQSDRDAKGGFTMAQITKSGADAQGQGGVPARFVSALDNKGHEMVEDYGYKKAYQYQLVDGKGHPFKASDLKNQEQKLSQSNPNAKVITSGPMRLSSQGILTDMVGLPRPPGLNDRPSHTVETFSNTVYWNRYPYPVSTVFRHDISVNHGVVTINATIDVP